MSRTRRTRPGIGEQGLRRPQMKAEQVSYQRFWEAMEDAKLTSGALILFTSGNNQDGKPWCPDCRRVDPLVREAAAASGTALVEVQVGEVQDWKEITGKHPLKCDPRLQLKTIPTLCQWKGGKKGKCLELERYSSETEVVEALEHFLRTST